MLTVEVFSNFSNGYILEYAPVDETGNFTSAYCQSWLLLPAENLWSHAVRGVLYVLGIIYLFIGVAIGSDEFMGSIEVITSKKRTIAVWDPDKKESVSKEVLVWNETVANLTLLALGSSAPEILLATVETCSEIAREASTGERSNRASLGFYTIVGSAAFNLLVITGICIVSVESPRVKKIRHPGVFILTSIWSLLAYLWLLVVLLWSSGNEVEWWEAWLTLLYFPLLVLSAYAQDNNWWIAKLRKNVERWRNNNVEAQPLPANTVVNGFTMSRRGSQVLQSALGSPAQRRRNSRTLNDSSMELPNGEPPHVSTGSGTPKGGRLRKFSLAHHAEHSFVENVRKPEIHRNDLQAASPQPEYHPFARARFRHLAIKALRGSSKRAETLSSKPEVKRKEKPRLAAVVSKLAAIRKLYSNNAMQDESSGSIVFAASTYSVLESAGEITIDVVLHRRRRPTGQTVIPTTNDEGKFDTKVETGAISVDFETREGTAKINKDFKYTAGTLIFTEENFKDTITVPIINDNQYYPDTDFYILLKNPTGEATLGDPSVTRVTIIDDDKPGDFSFESSQIFPDVTVGEMQASICREGGCDGNVSVHYTTIDGTAKGGAEFSEDVDYITTSDVVEFKHQETTKTITVKLNKDSKHTKNFVIVLRNPSQGSHLGENSAAVVNINFVDGNYPSGRLLLPEGDSSWSGQFKSAMIIEGGIDENGKDVPPSGFDFLLHFISMPWKVLFALVPPKEYGSGYPAFLVSLALIGMLTAVIEQLGHLLGCVTNLSTQVTGLTIIALGTSLPDTIASRTAALHDDYADASIGNITGSNSVNVFLGLGLPWVIRSIYHIARGEPFTVDTTNLEFSVVLFDAFGAVCVVILLARRFIFGGELGGKTLPKWLSGGLLFTLWFTFIVIASLKAHGYF